MPVVEHSEPDLVLEPQAAPDAGRDVAGWGEMIVALATIGTLLLTVWILVGFGVLEGDVAPSLPEDLEVFDEGVDAGADGDS